MRICLPDCHPSRYSFLTLAKDYQQAKSPPDNGMPTEAQWAPKNNKARWRNMTQAKYEVFFSFFSLSSHCFISDCLTIFLLFRAGWVDCWSVPNFLLIVDYTWHPIYPQKTDEQLKRSCKLISIAC